MVKISRRKFLNFVPNIGVFIFPTFFFKLDPVNAFGGSKKKSNQALNVLRVMLL